MLMYFAFFSQVISTTLAKSLMVQSRLVLQSQDLRVGQKKKPYIGFTQENLIENSVQDCLSYILKLHGPC